MAATRDSWWVDLLLVGVAATVPAALVYGGVEQTSLRVAAGLPLAIFLPGYALVSAMYPEAREDLDPPMTRETGEGIDRAMRTRLRGLTGIDRLGLAVALSAALTPAVALLHYVASGSFAAPELAAGLGVLTWGFVFIGLARRLRLSAAQRFGVDLGWPSTVYERYFVADGSRMGSSYPLEARSVSDVALNVLLACVLLVALTSATYAFTQPPPGQDFEELAVVTQNDTGEYVAGNYPDDLSGSEPLYVGVTNQRDGQQTYVLRGTLEVVDAEGNVVESDEQLSREVELAPGERTYVEHDPEPTIDGERLRLSYTLERTGGGDDGPDRRVHVWISGAPEGSTDGGEGGTPTVTPVDEGTPTPEGGDTPTPDGSGAPTPTDSGAQSPTPTSTPTETDDGISIDI